MNSDFKKPDSYKSINNSQVIIDIHNNTNKIHKESIDIENVQETTQDITQETTQETTQEATDIENPQKKNIKIKDNFYSRYNLYKLYYDFKNFLHL
tara:strand:+ start:31 stop:318 length:288 start_codon:yes stop_codon:yes gene_type:complete